jgi:hypothetical protein
MSVALAVGLAGIPLALLVGRWARRYLDTLGIERRLDQLQAQLHSWQAAHDHQVDNIDRRLNQVEECAARAENEARIVSAQLGELTEMLSARLRQVEHRLARGLPPAGPTGACGVGPAGLRSRQVVDAGAEW